MSHDLRPSELSLPAIGSGLMARHISSFDWSNTPLGRLETWPVSLLSAVRIMLGQQHASCIFWGSDLTMLYNDAYAPILGARQAEALGAPAKDVWPEIWTEIASFIEKALAGEGIFFRELPLTMTRNGYDEQTYWTFSYSPLYDDDGIIRGMINVAVDETPSVEARALQDAMRSELSHRMKNMLAVTSAVVSSSLRASPDLEHARETVTARIRALGQAQQLLQADVAIDITEVINRSLAAHLDRDDRLSLQGPPIILAPDQALGLSLILFELATNALKYGALSAQEGRVSICWTRADDGDFTLDWTESGGPTVSPPSSRGFGSQLLHQVGPGYFFGTGDIEYNPEGVTYRLLGRV
ncbi:sensor histidine kinase [Pararhodobacter zhoushanensis]|uniref:histidine kinase n=1 Tax=Pararhodobacter zhoushanensis TaxID=2479545 RepID=A0ABT3H4E4_9RHOB|nr:HWE histidine kinase domain-containing protein [Pararhodobacter zhoushanensis]MCW1934672.1 PAS domain-containing protein [Pararhodobacter zhoushanensis]